MPAPQPTRALATRERILDLLHREPLTARELAARLGVTHNAVRVHLAALERAGQVHALDTRRGTTRPAAVHALTRDAESARSRVYAPFASQLMAVLGERLPEDALDGVMREVGRRIARTLPRPEGDLPGRVARASAVLEQLGAPNDVVRDDVRGDGHIMIRGHGCSLGEAVHAKPAVCHAMETLLAELVDAPVRERCERGARPRCRFEIIPDARA
jgi:predicted ArsR family transcriptional regulator